MHTTTASVDQYIKSFPKEIQSRLRAVRKTIRQAAPEAEEGIGYGIPAYKYHGALVYFAGYKNHIGLYPAPTGVKAFEKELKPYASSKATAQFRHDAPIPFELIAKIVRHRLKENREKAEKKKTKRTCRNGHQYFKSSDCPTCPVCEAEKKQRTGFLPNLSAPAQRALTNKGISSLHQLTSYTERDLLALHGVGQSSIPKIKQALAAEGLQLKNT